ncbi:hypothetical protein [Algoriphagus sp.]|uniref:hypothetical protein n=1 Tax=Algoriphagus sp. TaxID=1872435 RepID=UPI00391CCA8E
MKNPFWCLIPSVNKWLIVPFLLIFVQSYGQEKNTTYFYSSNERMPLSYLRVQVEGGSFMDFTNLTGKLEYLKKEIPENSLINISGYGINDTLLSIKQIWDLDTIFLKTKDFVLPEFAINSTLLSELKIGDASAGIREVSNPITLYGGSEDEFYRYTIRVKTPKKKQLHLDEIKFHISQNLKEKVNVSLRILAVDNSKNLRPGKNNSISEFVEVLREIKIVSIDNPGWNTVGFNEPIPLPKNAANIFIVFDLLGDGEKSGFSLSDQTVTKNIDLGFYITGGIIGVFESSPIHPAVEVTFLIE